MDHALAVGEGHRLAHLAEDLHQPRPPLGRGQPLLQQRRQRAPLDEFHGVVRSAVREPAHRVDRHDERVRQLAADLRLADEPPCQPRVVAGPRLHHLDREAAAEPEVADAPHHAHAAGVDPAQRRVAGEGRRLVVQGPPQFLQHLVAGHGRGGGRGGRPAGHHQGRRAGGPRLRLQQRVDLEQVAQGRDKVWEAAQVLDQPRRLAPLLAQQHFVIEQVEEARAVLPQFGMGGQVGLHQRPLAGAPVQRLIVLEPFGQGLGVTHGRPRPGPVPR